MPGAAFISSHHVVSSFSRYHSDKVNKMLVGNKCDLTTKKVVDYTTAKVHLAAVIVYVVSYLA